MDISNEAYNMDPGGALVLRSSPSKNLLFVLAASGILVGAIFLGIRFIAGLSPMMILLLSIPMGITALIIAALFAASVHALLASLRPTNWSIQIGSQSLVINLRDYRTAIPGEPVPALRLPIQGISSMIQVTETWVRRSGLKGSERARIKRQYVDLKVNDRDTTQLAKILARERLRNSKKLSGENRASPFKYHNQHVLVLEPGVVRLAANKELIAALGMLLPYGKPRHVDLDEILASEPSLLRATALDLRGERMHATTMLSKDEGLSFAEARELLDMALEEASS